MSKIGKAAVWSMVAAGLVLPTSSALAVDAKISGRVHQWAPAGGDSGKTAVRDLGDSHWVKGEYNRSSTGSEKKTLWNKSGKGTTVYSAGGSKITKIHACEEHNAAPDICTAWMSVG